MIGELVNQAIRAYLGRPNATLKRGSLRDWLPEAYPEGNERLSDRTRPRAVAAAEASATGNQSPEAFLRRRRRAAGPAAAHGAAPQGAGRAGSGKICLDR